MVFYTLILPKGIVGLMGISHPAVFPVDLPACAIPNQGHPIYCIWDCLLQTDVFRSKLVYAITSPAGRLL